MKDDLTTMIAVLSCSHTYVCPDRDREVSRLEAERYIRNLAKERDVARENYEGAMEDLRSVVTAFARRCHHEADWESALHYLIANYPNDFKRVVGAICPNCLSSSHDVEDT